MGLENKTALVGILIGFVVAVIGVAMPLGFDVPPLVWRSVFCAGVFACAALSAYLLYEHFARSVLNATTRLLRTGGLIVGVLVAGFAAVLLAASVPEPKNYGSLILARLDAMKATASLRKQGAPSAAGAARDGASHPEISHPDTRGMGELVHGPGVGLRSVPRPKVEVIGVWMNTLSGNVCQLNVEYQNLGGAAIYTGKYVVIASRAENTTDHDIESWEEYNIRKLQVEACLSKASVEIASGEKGNAGGIIDPEYCQLMAAGKVKLIILAFQLYTDQGDNPKHFYIMDIVTSKEGYEISAGDFHTTKRRTYWFSKSSSDRAGRSN